MWIDRHFPVRTDEASFVNEFFEKDESIEHFLISHLYRDIKLILAMDPPQDCNHPLRGSYGEFFGADNTSNSNGLILLEVPYRYITCGKCRSSWVFVL